MAITGDLLPVNSSTFSVSKESLFYVHLEAIFVEIESETGKWCEFYVLCWEQNLPKASLLCSKSSFPAVYHAVHVPLVVSSGIKQFFFIFRLVFHHGLLFSLSFSLNPERVIKGQVPEATLCPRHAPLWASPFFPVKWVYFYLAFSFPLHGHNELSSVFDFSLLIHLYLFCGLHDLIL